MTHGAEHLRTDVAGRLTTDALLAMKELVAPLVRDAGHWAKGESDREQAGTHDLGVRTKTGPGDVVTLADALVQRRLAEALRDAYPGFAFVGEEGLDEGGPEAPTWVIDPIDGTHNFVRAYPGFCVSVGLVEGQESVFGAIYDSVTDTVTWAVRGGGAWCDGRRLQVRPADELANSLVATNVIPASAADPAQREVFWRLVGGAAGSRSSGAACRDFCLVASGKLDLFWQFGLRSWDVAAGVVIVREAGGRVTFAGDPVDWVRGGGLSCFAGAEALVVQAVDLARDLGAGS
ncbi:inositol monophosphatase family protein [soil metagenome]